MRTYFARRLETEPDVAAIPHGLSALRAQTFLAVKKDRRLLLERAFALQQTKLHGLRVISAEKLLRVRISAHEGNLTTCYTDKS